MYVFPLKYQWFGNQQEAAVNHGTLQLRRFMDKTAVIIEMLVAVVGVLDWFYI